MSKRDVRDAFDRAVLTGFYEAGEPWIEPWCEDHLAQGDPDCHACIAASHDAWMHRAKAVEAENTRLRELYENAVANRRQFGWTIDHLLECEEALRVAQAELAKHEAVLVAADRVYTAYQAMLDGENIGRLPEWEK